MNMSLNPQEFVNFSSYYFVVQLKRLHNFKIYDIT